jgi:hypothetical protein|tara:strand:+ start:287 stop:532 length:246 start_codon:yes stop_codon:yes gene_type:complete
MKPKYLVYILAAIIIAFVIRGYFCVDMVNVYLEALNKGALTSDGDLYCNVTENIESFKKHLLLSGVLATVIAVCCRLKAPK